MSSDPDRIRIQMWWISWSFYFGKAVFCLKNNAAKLDWPHITWQFVLLFFYFYHVARKANISTFLLCLLLLVNRHNSFHHSHTVLGNDQLTTDSHHDHDHHSDHHHQNSILHFWDWIKHIIGDFEHSDLGDQHLELFLNPNHQSGFGNIYEVNIQPVIVFWQPADLYQNTVVQKSSLTLFELVFYDSSFLDLPDNRGPPLFS